MDKTDPQIVEKSKNDDGVEPDTRKRQRVDDKEYDYVQNILVMNQKYFYNLQQGTLHKLAREDSETIFVKKFNNFIKSQLINLVCFTCKPKGLCDQFNNSNLSILDLCCGRGGDLGKWAKNGIAHYVGVDLSEALVEEAKRRYTESHVNRGGGQQRGGRGGANQQVFKAVFMVNDAANPHDPLDKVLKHELVLQDIKDKIMFDIVSTQFAIHYMFESQKKLGDYLKNVSDRLEPGGFFIGTTVDSDELIYRVRQQGSKDNTIQNDFMTIILPQDTFSKDASPFGLEYFFYLKEAIGKEVSAEDFVKPKLVDEYLVIFDVLVKEAQKYGLKLVIKKNFRQFYDDMTSEMPHSLK